MIDEELLTFDERATYRLRKLYNDAGYVPFRIKKFEEYEFYIRNKEFLVSDRIIAFNDIDGSLRALKPDVTLSIIKSGEDVPGTIKRVFYNENVYRPGAEGGCFREIMQTGLECIGDIGIDEVAETIFLAAQSLEALCEETQSKGYLLQISHLGVVQALTESVCADADFCARATACIAQKNAHELEALCRARYVAPGDYERLSCLVEPVCRMQEVLRALRSIPAKAAHIGRELEDMLSRIAASPYAAQVMIDFSLTSDIHYYNGFAFKGFIGGAPVSVLSGGQYDRMMQKLGRKSRAVGFAVYFDALDACSAPKRVPAEAGTEPDSLVAASKLPANAHETGALSHVPQDEVLRIALPKGRLGEQVYRMFARAGYDCPDILDEGRRLIFNGASKPISMFWVKPSDVAEYVARGAADIGVAGKDILLEHRPDVYELLDLHCGKCRMAVAGMRGRDVNLAGGQTLRVATKFEHVALDYFAGLGQDIDIIKLNGSIELAPIVGLSDVIVDIVETGATLRENNLEVKAEIFPISARLIANKASFTFNHERIVTLVKDMKGQVEEHD